MVFLRFCFNVPFNNFSFQRMELISALSEYMQEIKFHILEMSLSKNVLQNVLYYKLCIYINTYVYIYMYVMQVCAYALQNAWAKFNEIFRIFVRVTLIFLLSVCEPKGVAKSNSHTAPQMTCAYSYFFCSFILFLFFQSRCHVFQKPQISLKTEFKPNAVAFKKTPNSRPCGWQ